MVRRFRRKVICENLKSQHTELLKCLQKSLAKVYSVKFRVVEIDICRFLGYVHTTI